MADQVSVVEDIVKGAIFRDSMDPENTVIEGPHPANGSKHDASPSFLPPFTFEAHEDEADSDCSARTSLDLETDFQAELDVLLGREWQGFDDTSEDDLDPSSALTQHEDTGVLASRAESSTPPRAIPTSPEIEVPETESSHWLQIPTSSENRSISHARSSSGFSNSSTLVGTEDENEEFPMRKDRSTEDVIQVIEIPIVRKRRSTILGKLKQTLGSPPRESKW